MANLSITYMHDRIIINGSDDDADGDERQRRRRARSDNECVQKELQRLNPSEVVGVDTRTICVWRGVAWRGGVWRGVAWRGVAWRGVA